MSEAFTPRVALTSIRLKKPKACQVRPNKIDQANDRRDLCDDNVGGKSFYAPYASVNCI